MATNNGKDASKDKDTESVTTKGKYKIEKILIVAAVVGIICLVMSVGDLAKSRIEKIASNALGVSVSISEIDVNLQNMQIIVSGINIGNPLGYSNSQAIIIDTVSIAAQEISKELLVFTDINVTGTNLNLEVSNNGTNLTDLRAQAITSHEGNDKPNSKNAKVIINTLNIDGTILHPTVTLVGEEMSPITLPSMRFRGIGESTHGVSLEEAMSIILDGVTQVATKSSAELGYLQGMSEESLKDIQEQLNLSSGIMDQFKGIGSKVRSMFGD